MFYPLLNILNNKLASLFNKNQEEAVKYPQRDRQQLQTQKLEPNPAKKERFFNH